MVQIRKARRSASKLRALLTGPSGSGKTYSALLLAKGLGGRTVVIDTEEGSSDLYDTLHDFDVVDLKPPFTPERYIEAITACEQAGYEVIVIDSITHEWNGKGGCLELVDDVARAKFKGNTWSAYSEITPRHRAFIDAMLRSSAHIVATARSKTETAQVDEGGRKKVVKLGMAVETRQGAEYEFTTVLDLVHDGHYAVASKDRTGMFGGDPKPVTVETGRMFADWLAGATPAPPPANPLVQQIRGLIAVADPVKLDAYEARIIDRNAKGDMSNVEMYSLLEEVNQRRNEITAAPAAAE